MLINKFSQLTRFIMYFDISPLFISLKTALLATFLTFFIGVCTAYFMFKYRGKFKSLIEGLFLLPLILPPTVVGFLLLLLFGKNGFVGRLVEPLDISLVFTWYGAVIAAVVVSFPIMYKTALGAFTQIDIRLIQVARTLGASEWNSFWRITIPLALPGIFAGTTLVFTRALGEFGATLMLAGNIPGQTQTIPMAIYFAVESGAMNEAWSWSLVIIAISLSSIIWVDLWQELYNHQRKGKQKKNGKLNEYVLMNAIHLPSNNDGLVVDIEKSLPGFHLQVCFATNNQTLGLLGGSGAGKSMVLRCIAGIETPSKGHIILNGKVLFDSKRGINLPSRDRCVGLLMQNYALFPHMTVRQNIAFGLPKQLSKLAIEKEITSQLATMQLEELSDRYPHELSGGQQQRVALSRVLVSQPKALLLDEPFSAIDNHLRSKLEQQMISILSNYQGISLFVTHDMEEAYRICPNLLVMEQGKEAHHGSRYEVFQHPNTVSVAKLTGCKNFSRAFMTEPQIVKALDWDCDLQIGQPISNPFTYVGIRAHQIVLNATLDEENTFLCWLVRTSETFHRMTLFLKLHSPPNNYQDYHLEAEIFKEKWEIIREKSLPWCISLKPMRLMLMA
ncbi:Molybdenum transport system permease protein ModB (TC 3.A.1.8.1) / Molybdenum transport ATP-binding protein ModC (TC 3.A.1.8.1) [Richelia intracellularis HH01]|uniref:Molybdenum transport system permease protein ModB (TC 3.A.1.8.1) / Molybdenum transport ATP-binding protein ModC (TC 3.A.1.8.1) n=2 Tax=Richelia TaxID=98443 RepID=M1WTM1_9NOST|nr:Molybdenum transport system permease protein ModB (TC 3.A.1.8.1) / Molybdenum transport ATP-binding protein ModC (TC 3.A.1.8.1) [Richelia intracellularis HH01]HAE06332.1 molybdate ABC transporter permease subunit [Richelia sp.]